MRRLLLISFATLTIVATSAFTAIAMPTAKLHAPANDGDVVLIKGGHGHGHGHMGRGGRGHHYGWGRGRGHHYGWYRGRHRGRH